MNDSTILFRGAPIAKGAFIRKDAGAGGDKIAAEAALTALTTELSALAALLKSSQDATDKQFRDLTAHFTGVKDDNGEIRKSVEKHAADYAEMVKTTQALESAVNLVRKELDAPVVRGGKDLEDSDRRQAIELQRRQHIHKHGSDDGFRADTSNLMNLEHYRSAVRKLMRVGVDSREKVVRDFTQDERKAFDNASMDSNFFMPEILGMEMDCAVECAYISDLYASAAVSRSNFMYPVVKDYAAIGKYGCDAECDAELGPAGNISYNNGRTFDFRGIFCFQKKVLEEANYDLLGFMLRSVARSYRINRNNAMIKGDGKNEPLGWMTADLFEKRQTGGLAFNHQDARRFITSAPVEYGAVTSIMHQNMFAYLASTVDNNGRFIFGDGLLTFSPDDTKDRLRISNCLPDATGGNERGKAGAPFVAGDFIMATGNWEMAYTAVNKKPMWMEQYVGKSSAWCTQYQFGAEDGGFVACEEAARILTVGAS